MDAWIKIILVMFMMSALSMVIGYILFDPFIGLIMLAVLLTLMVLTFEPATGKAMAQVVVPIIIILFVFQTLINPTFQFNIWMLAIVGIILYALFAMFTGGGSMEGALLDAKVSLKLFPLFGLAIFISMIVDPTYRTTVQIMAGTIFALMALYVGFLRGYDEWPQYEYSRDFIALTDINPKGKVKSGAEIWWAKTSGPPIKEGERVIALGMSGLTMIVAKEDSGYSPQ